MSNPKEFFPHSFIGDEMLLIFEEKKKG